MQSVQNADMQTDDKIQAKYKMQTVYYRLGTKGRIRLAIKLFSSSQYAPCDLMSSISRLVLTTSHAGEVSQSWNGWGNQTHREMRSRENQTDGVRSRIPILFITLLLTIEMKTAVSESQAEVNKPITVLYSEPCDWLVLPLLLPTLTI